MELVTDIDEHVCELFIDRVVEGRDLGMQDDKHEQMTVTIDNEDYEISQSLSILKTSASSTGAVLWRLTPLFAEWFVANRKTYVNKNSTVVVELGCGVAGLLANVVAPYSARYLATDQHHLLKVLRKNIVRPNIETVEFDWEHAEDQIDSLQLEACEDGLVLACDTVYNYYLIPYFVNALRLVAERLGPGTKLLVAQQLRSEDILTEVLTELSKDFTMYNLTDVSQPLLEGYVVHYCTLSKN